jgi:hypothetical protein
MAQLCETCASQHELESPHFEDEFELETKARWKAKAGSEQSIT